MAIVLPMVLFSACSDDDDVDSALLEGSWGLVHSEGYDNRDMSEPLEWNYDCNPLSPSSYNDARIDIVKIEGNKYYMENYYYSSYSKKWIKEDDSYSMTLSDNIITPITDDEEIKNAIFKIVSLTSTSLTIEAREGSTYYTKMIYKKLQ